MHDDSKVEIERNPKTSSTGMPKSKTRALSRAKGSRRRVGGTAALVEHTGNGLEQAVELLLEARWPRAGDRVAAGGEVRHRAVGRQFVGADGG